jgi:hypothetical protein
MVNDAELHIPTKGADGAGDDGAGVGISRPGAVGDRYSVRL